ncbi:bacterio-opsin activator domain-containing protein [Natrarchaeobaculum sulfurireducens]|uniref:PAS domain S-box n=1 Tax=Natrarchaeobaculum sulfurireducens TaxID=2044521 RepID=A0A346PP46_9EURY|nr:bacterio-opsin activator domain-containing protein [Natrarchaeobaculum sulfurireducens]AXR81291.1 PAS domain S-box [Natrarchaeobaculum sulfurireducens]
MSDRATTAVGGVSRVLVVGDSSRIDGPIDALETAFDPGAVFHVRTVAAALDWLEDVEAECVVCEFDPTGDAPSVDTLAAALEDVPILALTDPGDADRALEAGAVDVVDPNESARVVATRVRNAARHASAADVESARYRTILEHTDAVVCVLEPDGTITDANAAVDRRIGYTPVELEGTDLSRLAHPDDRAAVRETIADVSSGAVGSNDRLTLRFGRADGTWIVADLALLNRLEDPVIDGVVATITDAVARSPTDAPPAPGIDRLDEPAFTLGPDWELRYANEAATRLFDGNPEPGAVVWEQLTDPVRSTLYDRLREASASESVIRFGLSDPVTDDDLELTASPDETGLTVLARSVSSDETAAHETLVGGDRERLEVLESAVDALDDGVVVLDGETVRLANATLSRWAGGEPLVGLTVDTLFADDLAETVRERSRSTVVRWMEPVSGDLAVGAEPRAVDVFVVPLPQAKLTLCVVRDRRRSAAAALSAVRATTADLRRAPSRPAARRSAVDGIRECLDAEFVGWYTVDEGLLSPAAVASDEAIADGEPRSLEYDDAGLSDLLEREAISAVDRPALVPVLERAGIQAERVVAVPVGDGAIVLTASSEPLPPNRLELTSVETIATVATLRLEELGTRRRVRECRRHLSRAETDASTAARLQTIERELLAAETRDAVEQRLCAGIRSLEGEATDAIDLVWVGGIDAGIEMIDPRTWDGDDGAILESASIPVDDTGVDPTGRAAASRDIVVVEDLEASLRDAPTLETPEFDDGATLEDDERTAWTQTLLTRGVRSVLAVPIEYEGFQYGVLTAYATRYGAFDDRTRRATEQLATVAGHALGSLQRKRALLADAWSELELALRDETEPLSAAVRRLDRRLDVRSVVPRSSGGSTVYCAVADVGTVDVEATLEDVDGVGAVRQVGEATNGTPVELVLAETSVAGTIADHGGRVRSVRPAADHTKLVVDLPSNVGVRPFVRALERVYPGTELLARREEERTDRSTRPFDTELRERLSDRQLRTLETAYYSGFFEWPRESTGEDVAESLGVSQPTFSRHFRTAQRKLFELLFDNGQE